MSDRIRLTQLAPRLKSELGDKCPTYRVLYFMMLDGVFSMHQDISRGGYYALENDLPAITEAVRQAVSAKRRQKIAA